MPEFDFKHLTEKEICELCQKVIAELDSRKPVILKEKTPSMYQVLKSAINDTHKEHDEVINRFLTAAEKANRICIEKRIINSFYGASTRQVIPLSDIEAAQKYHNFIISERRPVERIIDDVIFEQADEKDMDPVLIIFNCACQENCTKILLVPRHLDVQDMEKYLRKVFHYSVIITDIRILKPFDRTKGRFTK